MSPIATLLWVLFVTVLWVGILAVVWAILTTREEYPPEVSQSPTNE